MSETFRQLDVPVPSEETIIQTIGIPLVKAVQIAGGISPVDAPHAVDLYRKIFMEREVGNAQLFQNVSETVTWLAQHGYRLAVVTSRNRPSLEMMLGSCGLLPLFEELITNNDNLKPKPAPDMVLTLLQRMALFEDEVLVVGDTTYDIDMGNYAHCWTCAVTYGNHSRQQLLSSNPNFIIDSLEELKQIIR